MWHDDAAHGLIERSFRLRYRTVSVFSIAMPDLFGYRVQMTTQAQIHPKKFWFHGASLGDLMALRPIINGVHQADQQAHYLTYWTSEANRVAGRLYPFLNSTRAPLPLKPIARSFIERHQIDLCVLEYLELYPGWVHAMTHQNKPIGVVNGRVTHRSLRIARFLKSSAQRLDFFWAQSGQDAEFAEAIGVRSCVIEVMGSTKYDALLHQSAPCCQHLRNEIGEFGVVVGSVHPDEERALMSALDGVSGRVLIAPRYLKRVPRLLKGLLAKGLDVALRSQHTACNAQIVILDTVGELHAAYGLADVAIVGGTFGARHGQNLFEPISMGCRVIFGPHTDHIFDQVDALDMFGVRAVSDLPHAFAMIGAPGFGKCPLSELQRLFPPCAPQIASRLLNWG